MLVGPICRRNLLVQRYFASALCIDQSKLLAPFFEGANPHVKALIDSLYSALIPCVVLFTGSASKTLLLRSLNKDNRVKT